MVTKKEQLEWMAKEFYVWPGFYKVPLRMSNTVVCEAGGNLVITREEWQQERDKMSSKPEVDSSWHERGELPPVDLPVELWVCGSFAYNCELISRRGNNYVLWNLDSDKADSVDYMHSQFRPLRTEREKEIEEMIKLIGHGYMSAEMAKDLAIKMHDAGYHK